MSSRPSSPTASPEHLLSGSLGTGPSYLSGLPLRSYSPPTPAAQQCPNRPEYNAARLVDYRGAKVAAFPVDGVELLCLPQAFELFLRHLVGGLHTVYTKLKRLGITPLVCNVEQVRVLRGLGAIQPGVNRCKLIGASDFDVLYDDCTSAGSRPGRPPKRASSSFSSPGHQDHSISDNSTEHAVKMARLEREALSSMERRQAAARLSQPPNPYPFSFWPYSAAAAQLAAASSLSLMPCHPLLGSSSSQPQLPAAWGGLYRNEAMSRLPEPKSPDRPTEADHRTSPSTRRETTGSSWSPEVSSSSCSADAEMLKHYPYFPRRPLPIHAKLADNSGNTECGGDRSSAGPENNDREPQLDTTERPDMEHLLNHILRMLQAVIQDIHFREQQHRAEKEYLESQFEQEKQYRKELEKKLHEQQKGKEGTPSGCEDVLSSSEGNGIVRIPTEPLVTSHDRLKAYVALNGLQKVC